MIVKNVQVLQQKLTATKESIEPSLFFQIIWEFQPYSNTYFDNFFGILNCLQNSNKPAFLRGFTQMPFFSFWETKHLIADSAQTEYCPTFRRLDISHLSHI